MSDNQLRRFYSLSDAFPVRHVAHAVSDADVRSVDDVGLIPTTTTFRKTNFGIVKTNCFSVTSSNDEDGLSVVSLVLFPRIARINHSCLPNCHHYWSNKAGVFIVRAVKDIEPVSNAL